MKEYMVFSLLGPDRAGLVDRISEAITGAKGNLEDSRMAVLGGEFAMHILCTIEAGGASALEGAVHLAAQELGLLTLAKKTTARPCQDGTMPLAIKVRGMDHEGIVHEVTHYLGEQGITVEFLDTQVAHAPHSGIPLFSMNMKILAPSSVSLASLRKSLELVGDRLNVDVDVETPVL
jgi:glycine cleavage system transcriptional repressor